MKFQHQIPQVSLQLLPEQQNMASLYADQYITPYRAATAVSAVKIRGEIRMIDVTYTMVGTEATDDNIYLARLHPGEKVMPQLSDVVVEVDLGTTATIDVGDTNGSPDDDDYYATALACSSVGRVAFDELAGTSERLITEECDLIASFASLVTPAAGGRIRFRVAVARVG